MITVSLALHTSLFAMAANQLRTISPTEFLMQMILPEYTAKPIEDDSNTPNTDEASDKTSEETQAPAPTDTEEPSAKRHRLPAIKPGTKIFLQTQKTDLP